MYSPSSALNQSSHWFRECRHHHSRVEGERWQCDHSWLYTSLKHECIVHFVMNVCTITITIFGLWSVTVMKAMLCVYLIDLAAVRVLKTQECLQSQLVKQHWKERWLEGLAWGDTKGNSLFSYFSSSLWNFCTKGKVKTLILCQTIPWIHFSLVDGLGVLVQGDVGLDLPVPPAAGKLLFDFCYRERLWLLLPTFC